MVLSLITFVATRPPYIINFFVFLSVFSLFIDSQTSLDLLTFPSYSSLFFPLGMFGDLRAVFCRKPFTTQVPLFFVGAG
ncbi:hypothetical protein BJ742DRAFT_792409 [Cladochytrium replicatum]|nr:hypothetical protein BJ742DRAFT_792409 [Cladochytrium replicatum]